MGIMLWKWRTWKNLLLVSEWESVEKAISLTSPGISLVKEEASLSTF